MLNRISLQLQQDYRLSSPIEIKFYPYAGVRHTIRIKKNRYLIRLSDTLQEAPESVVYSISAHLLRRIHRQKTPPDLLKPYEDYIKGMELHQVHQKLKLERGRAPDHAPHGAYWNLEAIFNEVNQGYFGGKLTPVKLRWSSTPSYQVLGRWEPAHRSITISKVLDHPQVPWEVMHWIMAHEILHSLIPVTKSGSRYNIHPPEFRKMERELPVYLPAIQWLKTRNLKRLSKPYQIPLSRAIISL